MDGEVIYDGDSTTLGNKITADGVVVSAQVERAAEIKGAFERLAKGEGGLLKDVEKMVEVRRGR